MRMTSFALGGDPTTLTLRTVTQSVDSHGVPRETFATGAVIYATVWQLSERDRQSYGRTDFPAELGAICDPHASLVDGVRVVWSGEAGTEWEVVRVDRTGTQQVRVGLARVTT